MLPPSIHQMTTSPVELRQRMSGLPLPVKSVSANGVMVGKVPRLADDAKVPPLMNHREVCPLLLYQRIGADCGSAATWP